MNKLPPKILTHEYNESVKTSRKNFNFPTLNMTQSFCYPQICPSETKNPECGNKVSRHQHICVGSDSVIDRQTVKPRGLTLTFVPFNTPFISFQQSNLASLCSTLPEQTGHCLSALFIQQKAPTMRSFRAPCSALGSSLSLPGLTRSQSVSSLVLKIAILFSTTQVSTICYDLVILRSIKI